MLTTVIIILREVLEASILISLLLALHLRFHFHRHWLSAALGGGLLGAWLYARAFADISNWMDGVGQEIVNGFSLLVIGLCLGMQLLLSVWQNHRGTSTARGTILAMSCCAALIIIMAIAREGAEIMVYYSSMNAMQRQNTSMIVGGIIGAGLGISMGILVFTLLYQLNTHNLVLASALLITLITAGIMAEAIQYFIQAGWIMADEPLWDTSHWIAESSVTGQLLYAIFAYEASPTTEEVIIWCVTFLTLITGFLAIRRKSA